MLGAEAGQHRRARAERREQALEEEAVLGDERVAVHRAFDPAPGPDVVPEQPHDAEAGVQHQATPQQPLRIGVPRALQQGRRLDRAGGDDDQARVQLDRARRQRVRARARPRRLDRRAHARRAAGIARAIACEDDRVHVAVVQQLDAGGERVGDVGDQRPLLGVVGTPGVAKTAADAAAHVQPELAHGQSARAAAGGEQAVVLVDLVVRGLVDAQAGANLRQAIRHVEAAYAVVRRGGVEREAGEPVRATPALPDLRDRIQAQGDVDGRATADAGAAAHDDRAVVGAAQAAVGVEARGHLVLAAGHRLATEIPAALQQRDAQARPRRQRRRQHAARRARADDDDVVVEGAHQPSVARAPRRAASPPSPSPAPSPAPASGTSSRPIGPSYPMARASAGTAYADTSTIDFTAA